MRSGWVICVTDTYTRDQALKMFPERRENVWKKIEILKSKYDAITKDRFRITIHSPYSEIEKNLKIKIFKNQQTTQEVLNLLLNVDPVLVESDVEYCIIEIGKHHSRRAGEILQDTYIELVEST